MIEKKGGLLHPPYDALANLNQRLNLRAAPFPFFCVKECYDRD